MTLEAERWEGPALGVLCAFRFHNGIGHPLETPDLDVSDDAAEWTWTHLRLGDVRAQAAIKAMAFLPPAVRELFRKLENRVQIEQDEGWVYGVLPDFERDLAGKTQGEGRLAFAFDSRRLITGRLHALLAVDDLRHAVEQGLKVPSPAATLVLLIEHYVERVEDALEDLGSQIAAAEDYVLTELQNPRHVQLPSLRRAIARQRRELQILRTTLWRTYNGRHGRTVEFASDDVHDLVAWLEDADREAGALQERGRLLYEEIDALISAATNRSMRTLTVISTLLIPPTLIVGAFGMNLPGIPFEHSNTGFFEASGLCVAVVVAALWLLRRMNVL
ncbi:MAG TPA: CorA family divalent cation transporter [Caulobacteraceae bacterium]